MKKTVCMVRHGRNSPRGPGSPLRFMKITVERGCASEVGGGGGGGGGRKGFGEVLCGNGEVWPDFAKRAVSLPKSVTQSVN